MPENSEPSPFPEILNYRARQVLAFVRHRQRGAEAWLVGGSVRDGMLHRETRDLDLVVSQGAVALARSVADAFGGGFFPLDEERDVARAIVRDSAGRPLNIDIARLRAPQLLDDLGLRDFTINAMAVDIGQEPVAGVIDPFGGLLDLAQGCVRAVSEGAFLDDPVRLLRAVRQAAELGFRIDEATYNLIRRDAQTLTAVALERQRDELALVFSLPGAWHHILELFETGLLAQVLPEAAALADVEQSPPHFQDAFQHTRTALACLEWLYALIWPAGGWGASFSVGGDSMPVLDDGAQAELAEVVQPYSGELSSHLTRTLSAGRLRRDCLTWAVLAHDWGKAVTRSVDGEGSLHFLGHEESGASLVQARMQTLRMASAEVEYVTRLVRLHMRPGQLARDHPPSRRAVYRFFHDAADAGPECVLLSLADHAATRSGSPGAGGWRRRLKTAALLLNSYFREYSERVDPPRVLNGRQIMSLLGIEPGPAVGVLLEELREAQAAGEVADAEGAAEWLLRHAQTLGIGLPG